MKDKLMFVTDPIVLGDIERNDFGSPIPAHISDGSAWVYGWSMEQYVAGRAIADLRAHSAFTADRGIREVDPLE